MSSSPVSLGPLVLHVEHMINHRHCDQEACAGGNVNQGAQQGRNRNTAYLYGGGVRDMAMPNDRMAVASAAGLRIS